MRLHRRRRLAGVSVNFGQVIDIDRGYERRGWGHRQLVRDYLISQSSSSPSQIGKVFSTVGRSDVLKRVDSHRQVRKGTSYQQLEELTERRNKIAHAGDRSGRGHTQIDVVDVTTHLANAKSIVESLDAVLT